MGRGRRPMAPRSPLVAATISEFFDGCWVYFEAHVQYFVCAQLSNQINTSNILYKHTAAPTTTPIERVAIKMGLEWKIT